MRLAVVFASLFAILYSQDHKSTRDGIYTDAQAERGRDSYDTACSSCHAATLEGSGAATPPLAGDDFTTDWVGQTVGDLFDRIQTSMPADRPGKLSRAENADILAYILKVNKFPAGQEELPSDSDSLKQIQYEAAK